MFVGFWSQVIIFFLFKYFLEVWENTFRICPGRFFANDTLFITFARLLWAATISPVVDDQTGKPVIPDLMATVGDGITM